MPDLPHHSETDLLVLHCLRCTGSGSPAAIAAASGLDESIVESQLAGLAAAGLVSREPGRWGLTGAGRQAGARRIAAELDESGTWSVVSRAYSELLELNLELLDLRTEWQTRDPADDEAAARVLDQFIAFDKRADELCTRLSGALARFGRYRDRLTEALDRARAGETGYLTGNAASYDAVWSHLHEDVRLTLGLTRH